LPSVAKDSAWMIVSRFGAQGLAVIFTVLIARRLGNTGFGEYAFVAALIFVANALTTFGTDMLLIREIAAKDDLSRLPSALLIQLLLSGVFILAVWLGGGYIANQSNEAILALRIYSLALIPLAFFSIFTTLLRGEQRIDTYTILVLATSLSQVLAILIFMKAESNIVTLSIVLLSVQTIVALLAGSFCLGIIPGFLKIWRFSFGSVWPVLKAAAPIAFLTLLGILYQKLSVTMLSTMRGPAETGIFSAAARPLEASKTIHLAVFAALYPALAQGLGDRQVFSKIEFRYFRTLLAGAAIAASILSVFAMVIVRLLYGVDYLASTHILQILAWTLIPFSVNGFLSLHLIALHKEGLITLVMAASLSGLLILSLWWIPLKGAEGAAWSFLVAECLQAVLSVSVMLVSDLKPKESHELSKLSR
jgi:O-antigen/teichoic acid export membrane protein